MRYAIVTGIDHGVGLELVKNLLERSYFVVACRLNPKEKQVDEERNTRSQYAGGWICIISVFAMMIRHSLIT